MKALAHSVTAAVLALAGVWGAAPASAAADDSTAKGSSTRDDLLAAMHGEAFAYLKYETFAAAATRTGQPAPARLFTTAAHDERYDHFARQARLYGLVGTDEMNLRDSIDGETYEATTMYPSFARQAIADGCRTVAAQFSEIARDEAQHAQWYRQALAAVTNPGSGTVVPVGEAPTPVTVGPHRAACAGRATRANLLTAMHGEGFAHVKYSLYAEHAQRSGQTRLATLFRNAAATERLEHFAAEANLAGLVGSTRANLLSSARGELNETTVMYPGYARAAFQRGDFAAATLFMDIANDELGHARAFQAAA